MINLIAGVNDWLIYTAHAIGLIAVLGLWILLRRGYLKIATYGLVFSVWLLVTLFTIVNGTVRSPAISLYILVIVVGGLLINTSVVVWITALCSVSLLGLVVAESAGWLPRPDMTVDLVLWASYTMVFSMTAIVVRLAGKDIVASLEHARQELAERQKIEETLREAKNGTAISSNIASKASGNCGLMPLFRSTNRPRNRSGASNSKVISPIATMRWRRCMAIRCRTEMLGKRLIDLYGGVAPEQNTRSTLELVRSNYRSKNRETREINCQRRDRLLPQ